MLRRSEMAHIVGLQAQTPSGAQRLAKLTMAVFALGISFTFLHGPELSICRLGKRKWVSLKIGIQQKKLQFGLGSPKLSQYPNDTPMNHPQSYSTTWAVLIFLRVFVADPKKRGCLMNAVLGSCAGYLTLAQVSSCCHRCPVWFCSNNRWRFLGCQVV